MNDDVAGARPTAPAPVRAGAGSSPTAGGDPDVPAAGNVGPEFYALAADAASPGPMGPPIINDARLEYEIVAARSKHPELIQFQTTAAMPPPEGNEEFDPLPDGPVDEESPPFEELPLPIEPEAIQAVDFSDPPAGVVVIASSLLADDGARRTRLAQFDMRSGEPLGGAALPDQAEMLDVSPDGTRVLVRLTNGLEPSRRPASTQTRIDVWDLSESTARHEVGWEPDEAAPVLEAAFVDDELILTLGADGTLALWDTSQHIALRSARTEAVGPLVLTPGRRGAYVFFGSTFGLFETDTLAYFGMLDAPSEQAAECPAAACSPGGERLAALMQRPAQEIVVWDLSDGASNTVIPAPVNAGDQVHFVEPGYLMAGGFLFDIEQSEPVWQFVGNQVGRNLGGAPVRRHLVAARPGLGSHRLRGISVPNERLQDRLQPPESPIMAELAPGDSLAVHLALDGTRTGESRFRERLARALGGACDAHGITLAADAELVLTIRASDRATGEMISFNPESADEAQDIPAHELAVDFALSSPEDGTIWSASATVPPNLVLRETPGMSLEQILVREMWKAAPEKIAARLDKALPLHVYAHPPEESLGRTRLWMGLEDRRLPE